MDMHLWKKQMDTFYSVSEQLVGATFAWIFFTFCAATLLVLCLKSDFFLNLEALLRSALLGNM